MFQKSCIFDEFLIKYFAVNLIIYSDMIQEKQKKISKCLELEANEICREIPFGNGGQLEL